MFYYFLAPLMGYNIFLILAAVIPAVFLMIKVYQSDRLEKESSYILWNLVKAGVFSSLLALVLERILSGLLGSMVHEQGLYQVLLYFVVVGLSEEGSKYFFLRRSTWESAEFNCQYDGVVYAAFVSLGFALWENISYVLHYGLSTALVRAVTAIPGHLSFGVFMGVFYGLARRYENRGLHDKSLLYRRLAVAVPVILHGAYDYIASADIHALYFVVFIAVLFFVSYRSVVKMSREDRYI